MVELQDHLILFVLLIVIPIVFCSPPPPDAAALLAFKSSADPSNRLRFRAATPHCRWPGVGCATGGKVQRLILEGLGLNGTFAGATLARLDQLHVLSLKSNALSGPVPDLSPLSNLKALFLSDNSFSGPFPASIPLLHRLRTLDLSGNRLRGVIPATIAGLDRLAVLRLDRNGFTGPVPPFNHSTLTLFNVSWNNLTGPVPVTAALSAFGLSAFLGNPGLCGAVVRRECSRLGFFSGNASSQPPIALPPLPAATQLQGLLITQTSSHSHRKRRTRTALAAAFGLLFGISLIIGIVALALVVKKRRRVPHTKLLSIETETSNTSNTSNTRNVMHNTPGVYVASRGGSGTIENTPRVYVASRGGSGTIENDITKHELAMPTVVSEEEKVKKLGKSGNLVFCAGEAPMFTLEQLMRASAELLGRGSVGATYKAVLDNKLIVTVKRIDAARLGRTGKEGFERHLEMVGRLRHPNLVPLRSYFQAKEERLLVYDYQSNGSLFSLIHGSRSSRAKHLHWTSCLKIAEDVAQGLAYIHQASRLVHGNVRSSNVLLGSDFEACLTDNCLSSLVEPLEGDENMGYRGQETYRPNVMPTPMSDIYSFGVLLLELLTGKPPLEHPVQMATDLPVWVRAMRKDEGAEDDRLMMLVDIATSCVSPSPESRPTTWQVLKMIQEVKEVDPGDDEMDSSEIS